MSPRSSGLSVEVGFLLDLSLETPMDRFESELEVNSTNRSPF